MEFDPGSECGRGEGDGSGGDLLLGVHEQVGAYPDVGEVIAKPGGAVDERHVRGAHDDEDVGIA